MVVGEVHTGPVELRGRRPGRHRRARAGVPGRPRLVAADGAAAARPRPDGRRARRRTAGVPAANHPRSRVEPATTTVLRERRHGARPRATASLRTRHRGPGAVALDGVGTARRCRSWTAPPPGSWLRRATPWSEEREHDPAYLPPRSGRAAPRAAEADLARRRRGGRDARRPGRGRRSRTARVTAGQALGVLEAMKMEVVARGAVPSGAWRWPAPLPGTQVAARCCSVMEVGWMPDQRPWSGHARPPVVATSGLPDRVQPSTRWARATGCRTRRRRPTAVKIDLVERLLDAGLPPWRPRACVHPRWCPQLADAAEELARWRIGSATAPATCRCSCRTSGSRARLRPRGVRIAVFASATDSFARRNLNRSAGRAVLRCSSRS